jgi:hypothetical protein
MSTENAFERRGQSLENEFFHRVDAQLAAELRARMEAEEQQAELAKVCGVQNAEVVAALVKAGIKPQTLAAFSLVPLVRIAWADRMMAPEEKAAILRAAAESHCEAGSAAHQLLESWLGQAPPASLFETWTHFVAEMKATCDSGHFEQLREGVLKNARAVAAAAGGFLGIHTISAKEEAALAEVAAALHA